MEATSKIIRCRRLAEGRFADGEANVIIERELPVFLDGQRLCTASLTPGWEKEFVTGYLFGQGFVNGIADIKSVEVSASGAAVTLKDGGKKGGAAAQTSYRIVSGGGKSAYSEASRLTAIKSAMKVNRKDIFRAMNLLFEKASLYRETEGTHAAGLFTPEGKLICAVEDIGRHNSLDKIIGYALLNRVDCANAFLVSTGRMASEMVTKICRAGIPLAATKTAVTDKGLETGKKFNMTIIGFVRDTGTKVNTDMDVRVFEKPEMKIYCGAERIESRG